MSVEREHVVELEGHLIASGLWCDTCLLPSVYHIAVTMVADPTSRLADRYWCEEHEGLS